MITNSTAATAVTRVKNVSRGRGPWNIRALPPIAPSPSPFGPCNRMTPITENASTKWVMRIAVLTRHLQPFPTQQQVAHGGVSPFVGAVTGALQVLLEDSDKLDDPAVVQAAVERATDVALAPWLRG